MDEHLVAPRWVGENGLWRRDSVLIKEPKEKPQACVIWMHGLGANAEDMFGLAEQLSLSVPVRHVCLNAPIRPVALNNHMPMRAWYNIFGLTLLDREDCEGIAQSEIMIQNAIQRELSLGFSSRQIYLAGFSQGGAMALLTGLHTALPLGGIIGLSTYLPPASIGTLLQSKTVPIFFAGGQYDPIVLPLWSKMSLEKLAGHQYTNVAWYEYPMEHSICLQEVVDLSQWLSQQMQHGLSLLEKNE